MSQRARRCRRPPAVARGFEWLESRRLLTGADLTIPLDSTLDQFGDQVVTVQAFDDASRAAFGIFDTGASAVTFSADDQAVFAGAGAAIAIKNPGGAAASGIGGDITGDVSAPGTVLADGMNAAQLTFDKDGFPVFTTNFGPTTASTSGIQTFVGTADGSPDLPTSTGTPVLSKSPEHPAGLAALVDMRGATLDFSDLLPGLTLTMPEVGFVPPATTLAGDATTYDPVTFRLTPYGSDNYADPGGAITETPNETIDGVGVAGGASALAGQSFLVDTGAQLSVISTAEAKALGFDLSKPETTIDVQGVGGTETVPGFTLKELTVPTADGGHVHLTGIPVYVLDVAPGIDGILGMNAFDTASKLLFNPNDPAGPTLSVTYLVHPDRGTTDPGTGDLGALLKKLHAGPIASALHGHALPGFAVSSTKLDTTPAVTPSAPAPVWGQPERFSISLDRRATGTVTLYDGKTAVASGPVSMGHASLSAPSLATGPHVFTVGYSGDLRFNPATSAPLNLTVARANVAVSAAVNPSRVVVGQPTFLTATVTAAALGAGAPTGLVQFLDASSRVIGSATLKGGVASASVTFTDPDRAHAIRALYVGDTHFAGRTSAAATAVVDPSNSATSLTAARVPPSRGARTSNFEQFVVTVAPVAPGAGAPSGTVILYVGSSPWSATLTKGRAVIVLPVSTVVGRKVVASYLGDARFRPSFSGSIVPR